MVEKVIKNKKPKNNCNMTLKNIKQKVLNYRDFYGADIMYTDRIKSAKNKSQIAEVIHNYRHFLELQAIDAQKHLDEFERSLNLHQ